MKRQPEGVPAGGQFAADKKAEPASRLTPETNAPTGLKNFPGTWTPLNDEGFQVYTSPGGTSLNIFGGDDPEVEYEGVAPEDSFQLYPRADDQPGLLNAINEALTNVAAQKATTETMNYSGGTYERMGLEAVHAHGDGGHLLLSLHITVRDFQNNMYLEVSHDYRSAETVVSDVNDGDLPPAEGTTKLHAIFSDLLVDQGAGKPPEETFQLILERFNLQQERFGLP